MKKLSLFLVALAMLLVACKPEIEKPTVVTKSVGEITQTTAKIVGQVTEDGGAEVTERGVCWSTEGNPSIADACTKDGIGIGEYTSNLADLEPNTTYYVKTYAVNSEGISYGEEKSFKTLEVVDTTLTVVTIAPDEVTQTTAKAGGNITADGNSKIIERGVCWSKSQNPTIEDDHASNGAGSGEFYVDIEGLTANTKYYIRAYAKSEKSIVYGNELSFTTEEEGGATKPVVKTISITDIYLYKASCNAEVVSDGGAEVTARGVCWSTNQNPTINDNKTTDGSGIGSYTSKLSQLKSGTQYYVRAYATNEKGTSYGEQKSFTTIDAGKAQITITDITETTAVFNIETTYDVRDVTIECDVVDYPEDIYMHPYDDYEIIEEFSSYRINGLLPGVIYYIEVAVYGDEYEMEVEYVGPEGNRIKTLGVGPEYVDLGLPSGTKWASSNLAATSIEDVGGLFRNYCYNEENVSVDVVSYYWRDDWRVPTIVEMQELRFLCQWTYTTRNNVNGYNIEGPNGNSIFMPIGNGNEEIYYKTSTPDPFEDGEFGTLYLNEKQYRTDKTKYDDKLNIRPVKGKIESPQIRMTEISYVTTTSAFCSAEVIDNGGTNVISTGICWSTSPNPTIADNTMPSDNSWVIGLNLPNLSENTKYYVRAYATNENSTYYSSEYSFYTKGVTNGHEWFNLGLPSGLKWATDDVWGSGLYAEYFSWGRIESYDYRQTSSSPELDFDISGNPEYDAAAAIWGGGWRMPTADEFQELIDYYYNDDIETVVVYDLHFSASGQMWEDAHDHLHPGSYWTSTPTTYYGCHAAYYYLPRGKDLSTITTGNIGHHIRPVIDVK